MVNQAREKGLVSGRTAGSHSKFDLYIWNEKEKTLYLIQVKTKRGARNVVFKDNQVYEGCVVITRTVSYE